MIDKLRNRLGQQEILILQGSTALEELDEEQESPPATPTNKWRITLFRRPTKITIAP